MTDAAPTDPTTPYPPVEPPAATSHFPDVRKLGHDELAAVSRLMSPGLVLAAYRRGIFPWPVSARVVPWVCPRERCVFPLEVPNEWSRSLRKTMRQGTFTVTFDRAFGQVITACATERRGGTWITADIVRTYTTLHELGWAHSVECWAADGTLAGGLYGLSIGGVFAGESMFHRLPDASKVAFASLVERLRSRGFLLLDAQVRTEHLASLGCVTMPRNDFLDRLEIALATEAPFNAAAP